MSETFALHASCWTSAGNVRPGITADESPHTLGARIDAARAAGFVGMGFNIPDLVRPLREGALGELKKRLDDAGMTTIEVELIDDWFVDGERRERSDAVRRDLFVIAEALGAHHIKVGGAKAGDEVDLDHVAEEFDELARGAHEHGTVIAFEPGAFSALADLDVAARVINGCSSPAGGVLLDVWHLYRTGFDYARLPQLFSRDRVFAVELDDGARVSAPDLLDDTLDNRLLCGDGAFDVVDFIRAIVSIGFDGPWGVEHMSDEHRMLPIDVGLRRAADAATRCLVAAHAGGPPH